STCPDGLLAPVARAWQGTASYGAVPRETRPHSRGAVMSVECSSRTLPACGQLCRKCNRPALGRPRLGMDDLAIRVHNIGLQPLANPVEQGPVVEAPAHHVQEPCLVHRLAAALAISFSQGAIPSVLKGKGEGADRLQRLPSGA